ncbi:MAG TPA: hypothetical protein VGM88_33190 [Kofleriaceae bacterium]
MAVADEHELIAVVSPDPAFTAALGDALLPAGMIVEPTSATPPALDELAARGRELTDRAHVTAAVWLVSGGGATTLVTYDRGVDRLLVRPVPYAVPLDAAQSAEVARMARTMLRALRVTPDIDAPPPRATDALAIRATAARVPIAPPPSPQARPAASFALAGTLAARVGGPAATVAPAGVLMAIWRPDGIGAYATVAYAPAGDRMTAAFHGSIADASVGLGARAAWRIAPRLQLAGTLGGSLHRMRLAGDDARFDPAATAGVTALYDLGPVAIGVGASADALLRRQTYLDGAAEILAVPPVQLVAGLVVLGRIL